MVEEDDESEGGGSDDRKQLLERIKRLEADSLGEIVETIMKENPEAFSQEEDKFSIFINQIDDDLWRLIREYPLPTLVNWTSSKTWRRSRTKKSRRDRLSNK